MFREMRRKRQALSKEECEEILLRATSGVLAVSGDDGYPYAVPLSYVYEEGKLFFHCAKAGHKLDAIFRNEKASFGVVGQDKVAYSSGATLSCPITQKEAFSFLNIASSLCPAFAQ